MVRTYAVQYSSCKLIKSLEAQDQWNLPPINFWWLTHSLLGLPLSQAS